MNLSPPKKLHHIEGKYEVYDLRVTAFNKAIGKRKKRSRQAHAMYAAMICDKTHPAKPA
jgi:hypothetical protein